MSSEVEVPATEINRCCICGDSVAPGSGNFVNRVPECSGPVQRFLNGYRYPFAEFICPQCSSDEETEPKEKQYDYYVDMDSFSVQAPTYEKARFKAQRYVKEGNYDVVRSIDSVGVLDEHEHDLDENEICKICGAWLKVEKP